MDRFTMHTFFCFVLFFLFAFSNALSQCVFMQKTHDFGQVANLDYPPAVFNYANKGNEPLAILIITKNSGIRVKYEQKFIQPGDSGEIFVLPDLNKLGPFREEISILTNASEKPEIISISGTVIAVQECFPVKENSNIREIIVTNRITKQPVASANIVLSDNLFNKVQSKTNSKGRAMGDIKTGPYHVEITAKGYQNYTNNFFLKRSVPLIFFEIDPLSPDNQPLQTVTKDSIPNVPPVFPVIDEALPIHEFSANNLVFLVDVSLSMKEGDKLGLLKLSVKNLVGILRSIDNVSLISYSDDPEVLLRSVEGSEKEKINSVIDKLYPHGITNGVKGLNSAYDLADKKFSETGNNQIILATDGEFSDTRSNPQQLKKIIEEYSAKGITLSIIGFGVDEKAIAFMKDIVSAGNGKYIHVSDNQNISDLLIEVIKENSRIIKN